MPLSTADKKQIIDNFRLDDNDTGSTQVQVALLSKNIDRLTEHLKKNHKDFSSKRGLLKMVARRRSLLQYLERIDEVKYRDLIDRLGLKR